MPDCPRKRTRQRSASPRSMVRGAQRQPCQAICAPVRATPGMREKQKLREQRRAPASRTRREGAARRGGGQAAQR